MRAKQENINKKGEIEKSTIIPEDIKPLSVILRTSIQMIGYRSCRKCEPN